MKIKLVLWEIGSFIWVVLAGSALHFSFELSEFWTPLAFISAVNESVWEHLKMYFWPGLIFALVQYTYTRDVANNYWYAKLASLIVTPLGIIFSFYDYAVFAIVVSIILMNEITGGNSSFSVYIGISFLVVWYLVIPLIFRFLRIVITSIPKLNS